MINKRFRYIIISVLAYIAAIALIYLGAQIAVEVTSHLPSATCKRGPTFAETYYTLCSLVLFLTGVSFGIFAIARTLHPENFS